MTICKTLEQILHSYNSWGILAFICIFIPVYWKQDAKFINGGQDILTIKKQKGYYFYGRNRDNPFWKIW